VHPAVINDAERQLDHFAELLKRRGITMRQPDRWEHNIPANTPVWKIVCSHATACPRDPLLVIGDEIIEAPMTQRARYFEFRAYRRLLKEHFAGGARWTIAPKPLMSDALYRECGQAGEALDFSSSPLPTEFASAFDAACLAPETLGFPAQWP
jgi:glycine amidinotransferase